MSQVVRRRSAAESRTAVGRRRAGRVVAPLLTVVLLLAVWEGWVRLAAVPEFVLPAPSQVARTAVEVAPLLGPHVATTLTEAAAGLALGAVAGLLLGIVVTASRVTGDAVYPLVVLTQTVPVVVLAPLMILWAGFGLLPKVILVSLTVFFPVLVSAVGAMRAVDAEHSDMVAGLGGTRLDQFLLVRLPASVPGALAGLRVAATYAVGAAVVAEYLAGQSGLGVFVQRSRKAYAVDQIFVGVVLIAFLSGLFFALVAALTRVATPWQRGKS
ncbi:ABC transporter permease [Promicromonospora sp. MEB111]|uniref:ABC transporter permease n=1 Tax=Promicromonospora sp. MEB111 TaxID=3040301 RepID=UPI00254E6BC0|nr:ABC transporter permease [Promicromonospora sp. MEB111]